jgi:hypothetical protein
LFYSIKKDSWELVDDIPFNGLSFCSMTAFEGCIFLSGIDEKNAVLSLKKLSRHQDIYDEFISGLRDDRYIYRSDDPVVVRGHTAEQLKSSYHVNVLGSYDLLIFLRENPKDEPFSLNSLQA